MTWYFCLAALALVATVVALDTSRRAAAAPVPSQPAQHAPDPVPVALAPPVPALAADGVQTHAWSPEVPNTTRPEEPLAASAEPPASAPRARQGRQLAVQVTAYSASVEEGTAWGITRSGTRARPGVVAVDPAVIPLGSYVRIAGLPGIYRAEDTGGGIRGAHVDVYMASRAAALQFGVRRHVLVDVLD
jgi:3D (Asp-Asp-Asp) domain-containing protein